MSSNQTEIVASDITGMRTTSWQVSPTLVWEVVTLQAVDRLKLPATQPDTDSPIIYHAFEASGELLPSDGQVADAIDASSAATESGTIRITVAPELEAAV